MKQNMLPCILKNSHKCLKKIYFLVIRSVYQLCFASSVSYIKNGPLDGGCKICAFVPCLVSAGLLEEMVASQ